MQPNIRTILFAAGLDKDSSFVLRYAIDMAQKYQAKIQIIHSHEALNITAQSMAELYMFQDGMGDAFEQSLQDTEVNIQAQIEQLCQQELASLSAPADLITGIRISRTPPRLSILEAVEEFQADVIIMGSHRHSVLADALLGSTTMKVLHSAKVPVFVVRIPKDLPE